MLKTYSMTLQFSQEVHFSVEAESEAAAEQLGYEEIENIAIGSTYNCNVII